MIELYGELLGLIYEFWVVGCEVVSYKNECGLMELGLKNLVLQIVFGEEWGVWFHRKEILG